MVVYTLKQKIAAPGVSAAMSGMLDKLEVVTLLKLHRCKSYTIYNLFCVHGFKSEFAIYRNSIRRRIYSHFIRLHRLEQLLSDTLTMVFPIYKKQCNMLPAVSCCDNTDQ